MNKRKVPKIRFKGFHDDWEQRKVSDLAEKTYGGGTPTTSNKAYWNGDIPWIQSSDVEDGKLLGVEPRKWITQDGLNNSAAQLIPGNSIAIITRVGVGKLAFMPYSYATSQDFLSLSKLNAEPRFTVYACYKKLQSELNAVQGTSIKGITKDELLAKNIMVPRCAEQQKIGAFFKQLDHLITLHQKKCLGRKKRDFTSASISWEQRKLGEIIRLNGRIGFRGYTEKDIVSKDDGGVLTFSPTNIVDNKLTTNCKNTYITRFKYDESPEIKIHNGDILFVKTGSTLGKSALVTGLSEDATLNPQVVVMRTNNLNAEFLATMLVTNTIISQVNSAKIGGAVPTLTETRIKDFDVAIAVSEAEKEQIGKFFSHLDHLITLHQRKLELLKRFKNSLIDRCYIGENCTMSKLILYHGSPNRVIVPKFGFGEDRHDYGRGFYLTENLELAKEWAVCRPDETNCWVHKYELELEGLNILDFQKYDVLSWLAELMKHRDAADSRRYKMLAQKFIEKYGIDTCGYDVITGWRANASYFYIAKEFVRDNIDIEILEELLSLGGLGIQFCIKSERAFAQLSEVEQDIMSVDYSEFNERYNERDINARNKMRALVDSDANKVTHVFSTLFER